MNLKILALLVVVAVLTIAPGTEGGWGRRFGRRLRRFGRRVWRGAKRVYRRGRRIYRRVRKWYKRNKWWVKPAAKVGFHLIRHWDETPDNLRALKEKDINEYDAFLTNAENSLQEAFPDMDFSDFADYMNEITEMNDAEIQEALASAPDELEDNELDDFCDALNQELVERITDF